MPKVDRGEAIEKGMLWDWGLLGCRERQQVTPKIESSVRRKWSDSGVAFVNGVGISRANAF